MPMRYRVCMLGCGPRGDDHLHGFRENSERFEVVGLCDQDPERLETMASRYGIGEAAAYTDAARMLAEKQPDVFCFATMPQARLPLVELGIAHGVRALAFEKPMALSLAEARAIRDACDKTGVKWLVSHQQKYGRHFRQVKAIVDRGAIGKVHTIHVTAQAWLMQLGTHMIDYALWMNGGVPAEWVMGQAHGVGKLSDNHPSPDYVCGQIAFQNGVRCIAEFGPQAPSFLEDPGMFWVNDAMTVQGSHGYARVIVGGGWQAFTKDSGGEVISGPGFFNPREEQPRYMADLARWLDSDEEPHPCRGGLSYHGFELAMGLCLSSVRRGLVRLPIDDIPEEPLFQQLTGLLPKGD